MSTWLTLLRVPPGRRPSVFHPMTAWADHGADANGEPLAIVLRAGNAGSNTAADFSLVEALAKAVPRPLANRGRPPRDVTMK